MLNIRETGSGAYATDPATYLIPVEGSNLFKFRILFFVFILINAGWVYASEKYSAGFQKLTVEDSSGERIPVALLYPSSSPEKPVAFGPFKMNLAVGGHKAEAKFPLIIISHGSGGSSLSYRSIALELARSGFVVAMPQHPRNNFKDDSAAGTLANWKDRPGHVRTVIDRLLENSELTRIIDAGRIAVIGHSMGGYTALAAAGGVADTAHLITYCESNSETNAAFCRPVRGGKTESVTIQQTPDKRIKALVLMAPVGIVFQSENALEKVAVPSLLLRAEKDMELAEPYHSELVQKNFADQNLLTYRVINNAGHYSFITPFPEFLKAELGEVAQDPSGFNRAAFHQSLGADIAAYLSEALQ